MNSAEKLAHVTVAIPVAMRRFTAQRSSVDVHALTARDALRAVVEQYPQLGAQLFADDLQVRRFINVFINSRDMRELQREDTLLNHADRITILAAIAGG